MEDSNITGQSNSPFMDVEPAPPDAIFGVSLKFNASTLPKKYLLSVGQYRTDDGKPYVFPSVSIAEDRILHKFSKEYLSLEGYAPFVKVARELLFGDVIESHGRNIGSVQTCAGTCALFLVSKFAKMCIKVPKILLSDRSWPNYKSIFGNVGHDLSCFSWVKDGYLDVVNAKKDLEKQPSGCLVVLQACAHNSTGIDPTKDEWNQIFESIETKEHIIVFDFAYMGLGSGDPEEDCSLIREYAKRGKKFFVCFSFSKCMGLYAERIGCLHAVCGSEKEAKSVVSQFCSIARATYSTASQNGAFIVTEVLSDKQLREQWLSELKVVSDRLITIREKFAQLLEDKTGISWNFLRRQRGMFCLSGLTSEEVEILGEKEGVFIPSSG
jgi:aspartate/tyrosine/aromatic aminotransferase